MKEEKKVLFKQQYKKEYNFNNLTRLSKGENDDMFYKGYDHIFAYHNEDQVWTIIGEANIDFHYDEPELFTLIGSDITFDLYWQHNNYNLPFEVFLKYIRLSIDDLIKVTHPSLLEDGTLCLPWDDLTILFVDEGGYIIKKDGIVITTLEDHCNISGIADIPIVYVCDNKMIIFNQDTIEETMCYTVITK
jgi:hypothetical protein